MNKTYDFKKKFYVWKQTKQESSILLVFMNSILKASAILKSHWSPEFFLCKWLLVKMEIETLNLQFPLGFNYHIYSHNLPAISTLKLGKDIL